MNVYSVKNCYKPPRAKKTHYINKCLILADSEQEAEQIFLNKYPQREGYGINIMCWDTAEKGIIWTYH